MSFFMHSAAPFRRAFRIAAVAGLTLVFAAPGFAQPDPNLKPSFGIATLRAGFTPDPYVKKLTAGGPIRTNLGGGKAYVAKSPDFTLNYTRGSYPLTIHVESTADTTLLVQLPDGKYVANDDGGKGFNPLIAMPSPRSGRYQIWVGTYAKKFAPATLYITERKVATTDSPFAKGGSVPAHQQGTAVNNVIARVNELQPAPQSLKLRRTNSNHVLTTYSAVTEHIQGITMIGNTYILSHSVKRGKSPMIVAVSPDRTSFHLIGNSKYPHAGALQACGNILALPVEAYYGGGKHDGPGSEMRFVDCSNPHNPVLLSTKISRPVRHAASAGIAYHVKDRCHYVIVFDDGQIELYKSNGHGIGTPACRFTQVASTKLPAGSQGGMQMLYDISGKLYVAAHDNKNSKGASRETIRLLEIRNPSSSAQFLQVAEKDLGPVELSVVQREPSFRWGSALVAKSANRLEAYAASRLLLYAPLVEQHTMVKRWSPDIQVRLVHKGGYVARFRITYTSGGKGRSWSSGNKTLGWSTTVTFPSDATNLRLHAEAMTFISTWRDIGARNMAITSGAYEVYGTTGSRKIKRQ